MTKNPILSHDGLIKILFLVVDPIDNPRLRSQQELRDIQERLRRSRYRDRFEIRNVLSVRIRDISQEILDFKPHIVHFSGHGTEYGELCFENELGEMQTVQPTALAALFKLFTTHVNCILLNACYSEIQAQSIVKHIPFVIGMNTAISDEAAIAFAIGFYTALGANRPPEDAFEFGRVGILLQSIPEELTPVLLKKEINYPTEPYYVEHPRIENVCYQKIMQPGALIRIKAPNSMGKTALMNRILTYARVQSYQTVIVRFQEPIPTNMEDFLRLFCINVGNELGLANRLDEYTDNNAVPMDKAKDYFQKYLLKNTANPLVLALDNVDLVFEKSEIASDFCSLLRSWNELARQGDANSSIWAKLRLIIVHSTENYSSMHIATSPLYNVGISVNLPELNLAQIESLVNRHQLNWTATQLEQLRDMLGGHPFLLQTACTHFRIYDIPFEELVGYSFTSPFSGHLHNLLNILNKNSVLREEFCQVVNSEKPVKLNPDSSEALHRLGLVKLQGYSAEPRCKLYRSFFNSTFSKS